MIIAPSWSKQKLGSTVGHISSTKGNKEKLFFKKKKIQKKKDNALVTQGLELLL